MLLFWIIDCLPLPFSLPLSLPLQTKCTYMPSLAYDDSWTVHMQTAADGFPICFLKHYVIYLIIRNLFQNRCCLHPNVRRTMKKHWFSVCFGQFYDMFIHGNKKKVNSWLVIFSIFLNFNKKLEKTNTSNALIQLTSIVCVFSCPTNLKSQFSFRAHKLRFFPKTIQSTILKAYF